jgi:hypothetical protein
VIERVLTSELDRGECPHMAVLLRSNDELPHVLASFYNLGAKRGGLIVHRGRLGELDRERRELTGSGLDVAGLEADRRLILAELNPGAETPEQYPVRWLKELDEALGRGLTGLWYARHAIGPEQEWYERVAPFEQAWDRAFEGRPVVQLCPFLVGDLDSAAAMDRLTRAAAMHHDGVLVPDGTDEFRLLRPS